MTEDEKQQVQNLINARMKLLNEKIALQEEHINSLSEEIKSKNEEIEGLKTQLTEEQERTQKLAAMIQEQKPARKTKTEAPKIQRENYLVSLLRQHFNYDSFRTGQEEIINALLSGRDVFCSMPHHYGKSLCYKLPALLMPGLTLVITNSTPDAEKSNAHSEILTPSLSAARRREIIRKIKNGTCKILYSGLKLLNEDDIKKSLQSTEISLAAIILQNNNLKECRDFISSLSAKKITMAVFSEASDPSMRQEINKLLRSPFRMITGFNKPDISFRITRTENKDNALNEILARKKDMPGVIYCSTPEASYKLRENLRGFDDLDKNIMIMPRILCSEIERNNIKFVVHYEFPDNLANYANEIYCAAFEDKKPECIIIASGNDFKNADRSMKFFCESKNPNEYMLSYLGQEEITEDTPENNSSEEIMPEDFSDFDFANANEAQKEAITSYNGPLLILAGPGTGKTFTLVQRAIFLIQKRKVKPENIMLASFTDKASKEIASRITEELSSRNIQADVNEMYAGTFHVICARILKEYITYTEHKKNFRVLDEFNHAYLIMKNMNEFMNIPGIESALKTLGKWSRSRELRDYINILSEELSDPEEMIRDDDKSIAALGHAMKLHDEILAADNAMSYSALLVYTYKLLRDNPAILDSLSEKIRYIMIDEYQDTNYVQEQLIFLLGEKSKNICVAGDDDQSLYRFRGATVRNILEFPEKFGRNECKIVRLVLNYRSRPDIVKFFNEWISDTGKFFSWENFRHSKKLEAYRPAALYPSVMRLAGLNDRNEWYEKILNFIRALKDSGSLKDYSQIAFLFRSVKSEAAQGLINYLESNNIKIYSPRSDMFFDRSEIKFAVGCLISMFPQYLKSLESGAFKFNGNEPRHIIYYRDCLKWVAKFIERPQYVKLKKWLLNKRKFHETFHGYTNYTYSDLVYQLFAFMPFNHALDADMNNDVKTLRPARNLSRLMGIIRQYEHNYNVNNINSKYMANQFQMMMNVFLQFRIDDGMDEYESDNEAVPSGHIAFMTIHQAKGMEFPVVFADSLWSGPSSGRADGINSPILQKIRHEYSRRPEFEPEDRIKFFDFWRLFYVAFSRAQDILILTCNEENNSPSRFFESAYNKLDDADEIFTPSSAEISALKDSGVKNIYSFTSHILTYELCPMQYKFYRELEFTPHVSNSTFMGTLVHATIEDIHRAVLNHEESRINEENISEWLASNYEDLSKNGQVYLSNTNRETALNQVMNYVMRNGSDWSAIKRAEYEVNIMRNDYILEGTIDLICIRDGETEITDFKSGSKPNININRDRELLETYRRQLNVYAYLVEKTSGLRVSRMKLYYTGEEIGSPEIIYDYDEDEANRVLTGFDDIVKKIVHKDFNHKASDLEVCRECNFRYYCGRA